MKKTLLTLTLILTTLIFSCSKKENVEPAPQEVAVDTTALKSSANARIDVCDIKSLLVKYNLTGLLPNHPKKWYIQYYDATTDQRLDVPTLISPTLNNVFYWKQNDSLIEYSYTGAVMDIGSWKVQECGGVALINTTLSGGDNRFVLEIVTPKYWQGTFYIPAGPNGALIKVRVKAWLYNR